MNPSEFVLTAEQEKQAMLNATLMQAELQQRLLKGVGDDVQRAGEAVDNVTYACGLVLLFPDLDLSISNYWSYLHSREVTITYCVQGEGLGPVKDLMRQIRLDGWGKPALAKAAMELSWTYRRGGAQLMLKVEPGKNAMCEKVVVGATEIPEKTIAAHQQDIYEVRCEGAEDYGELMAQDREKLIEWEEEAADERVLDTDDE